MYDERADRIWQEAKALVSHLRPPRLLAVTAATFFSVGTLARTFEIPDDDAWDAGKPLGYFLLAFGVLSGISAVISAAQSMRRKRDALLSEACLQLAAYIDDACPGIKLRDVGVHVWLVRGPVFARRLVRGPEFLLRERQKSNVVFVKGMGAVGQVWAEARDAVFDLGGEPSAAAKTKAEYDQLDPGFTRKMTWDEFERTRRYKAIWAAPLFRRERVAGVVSIDIVTSGAFDELENATVSDPRNAELEVVLAACERALSD